MHIPIESDHHAEPDTTSVATGQTVNTNDHVSTDQHDSTMSLWKKVSWNMTKYTLKLVKDSGAFPPAVQTVATK
jgi:uncharacterized protein YydD (DUF2326 family)